MSLAGYALIFAVGRLIGGLAVFLAGFLLIRRHGDRLMAVLMPLYFADFFINTIYPLLAVRPLIQGYRAGMMYV